MVRPEDLLEAMIEEVARVDRLREVVARAGFVKSPDTWVKTSDVNRAVAKLLDVQPTSKALQIELRRFLEAEGWKLRRLRSDRYWRARRVTVAAKKRERA